MLIFPGMIADAAKKAGMKVPIDPDDDESWTGEDFPHFAVFCNVQLGTRITWGNHWTNAEIIAAIPDDKIRGIMLGDLIGLGFDP